MTTSEGRPAAMPEPPKSGPEMLRRDLGETGNAFVMDGKRVDPADVTAASLPHCDCRADDWVEGDEGAVRCVRCGGYAGEPGTSIHMVEVSDDWTSEERDLRYLDERDRRREGSWDD